MAINGFSLKDETKIKNQDWALIGISWILIQIILLCFQGINEQGESVKYIFTAEQWVKGYRNLSLYSVFYFGYTFIHILLKYIGLSPKSMYVVQLIFSALATIYFTRILARILYSRRAIILSALLYTSCYIIQSWVSFLYTDSIFASLLVIATYFLLTEDENTRNRWILWVLLFALPFFRPVGFLFIVVAGFHWILLGTRKNTGKLLCCVSYLAIIGIAIYLTFTDSAYYFPIHSLHNIQANVICGYPGNLLKYQVIPYQTGMSTFSYLFHNPGMTLRLFLFRFYKVFSMTRPYFGAGHNLFLIFSTLIYYLLAVIGLISIFRLREKKLYFIPAGILIFAFPIVIFCVEWTGRFSLPIICYTLILSGKGIEHIITVLNSDLKKV
jgi:hypothetical protein